MEEDKPLAGKVDFFKSLFGEATRVQQSLDGQHPYLRLIGRVASEWVHFEHTLDQIIWSLAEIPDDIAICITGQMLGATPRFKAIEALGKHRGISEDLLKKTRQLKNENYAVVEGRNRVVHDPWFVVMEPTQDGQHSKSTTQLKSSPPGQVPVTEQEILGVIENIRELLTKAIYLQIEFMKEIYALPNRYGR